jgi:hypothetical protein
MKIVVVAAAVAFHLAITIAVAVVVVFVAAIAVALVVVVVNVKTLQMFDTGFWHALNKRSSEQKAIINRLKQQQQQPLQQQQQQQKVPLYAHAQHYKNFFPRNSELFRNKQGTYAQVMGKLTLAGKNLG